MRFYYKKSSIFHKHIVAIEVSQAEFSFILSVKDDPTFSLIEYQRQNESDIMISRYNSLTGCYTDYELIHYIFTFFMSGYDNPVVQNIYIKRDTSNPYMCLDHPNYADSDYSSLKFKDMDFKNMYKG